jgi:hypothetical protein
MLLAYLIQALLGGPQLPFETSDLGLALAHLVQVLERLEHVLLVILHKALGLGLELLHRSRWVFPFRQLCDELHVWAEV